MADLFKNEYCEKYDIPLSHLDYAYVEKCENVKELERILKVLRSGEEGCYPSLEEVTEKKIEKLNPKSRILRKSRPVKTAKDVSNEEWNDIETDLKNWKSEIKTAESNLMKKDHSVVETESDIPPVRGSGKTIDIEKSAPTAKDKVSSKKRVKPRDYNEWDKIDIDAELEKVDTNESLKSENKSALRNPAKPNIPSSIEAPNLTDQEKIQKAEREKDKGNEAFRAKDFEEALVYYNRSLSLIPTIASRNNRAQTYIKLKKWDEALSDCNTVLKAEPGNMKALLRRGVAFQGMKNWEYARNDIEQVLKVEPTNKRAQEVLSEIKIAIEEKKTKGKRMVIEEVDGDSGEEESTTEKLVTEKLSKKEEKPKIEVLDSPKKVNKSDQKQCKDAGQSAKDSEDRDTKEKLKQPAATAQQQHQQQHHQQQPSKKSRNRNRKKKQNKENKEKDCDKSKTDDSKLADVTAGDCAPPEKVVSELGASVVNPPVQSEQVLQKEMSKSSNEKPVLKGEKEANCVSTEMGSPIPTEPPAPMPPAVEKLKVQGNDLFKKGSYGEAKDLYTKAIDKLIKDKSQQSHNLCILYSNRANCFTKLGDMPNCAKDCNSALEINPSAIKPLVRRAGAYEAMDRYRKAYQDYRQTLYLDYTLETAQQGLNRCTKMLQQMDGSKWREKLPTISPISSPNFQTFSAISQNKTKSRVPDKISTVDPETEFNENKTKGNHHVQKGEFSQAVDYYTKCIKLFNLRTVPYTNRALCYLRMNKPDLVISDCSVALQYEPANVKALFRRAQAYKMQKNYTNSKSDLDKLLSIDPKNVPAKRELQLVITYIEEEKQKQPKLPEKKRHKIQIKEVESDSSGEEETKDVKTRTCHKRKLNQSYSPKSSTNQKAEAVSHDKTKEKIRVDINKSTPIDTETPKVPIQSEEYPGVESNLNDRRSNSEGPERYESPSSPTGPKTTPYEFIHTWSTLKPSMGPAPYAKLMEQVEPDDICKVISNKLDGDMLSLIIKCVNLFIDQGLASKGLAYLQRLISVPRFEMVTMFMSPADKKELNSVLDRLAEWGSCSYLDEDLKKLRKAYSL